MFIIQNVGYIITKSDDIKKQLRNIIYKASARLRFVFQNQIAPYLDNIQICCLCDN